MNLTELWTTLAYIGQVIPVEHFQKLVESMPRRVAAIIKAGGGPTLITRFSDNRLPGASVRQIPSLRLLRGHRCSFLLILSDAAALATSRLCPK
ncbi:hypothetical protein TNCV_1067091 [Trichonephila clavipes]|nr:hypothetical protein TNCV_1067091 [Trichonephila clavipes]